MGTILLSDKGKIERSSHQATSRAILTSSMAALYGIRKYDPQQKQRHKQHETYEAAVVTLDRLVHMRGSTTNGGSNNNNLNNNGGGKSSYENKETVNVDMQLTVGSWTATMLEDDCVQIDGLLESSVNSEMDCVNVLLEATKPTRAEEEEDGKEAETNKPTSTKRAKRTRGGTKYS